MTTSPLYGAQNRRSEYRDRLAAQLIGQGSDSSPVQHWSQGAARLAQALAGGLIGMKQDQRADERQKAYTTTMQGAMSAQDPGAMIAALAGNQDTAPQALALQQQLMAQRAAEAQRGQYVPHEEGGRVIGQRNTATGKIEYAPAAMLDQWTEAAGPGGLMGQRNSRTGEWKPADTRPVTNVNTNVATGNTGPQFGPIDKGYMMRQNPDGTFEQIPVKGGPADRTIQKAGEVEAEGKKQQLAGADIVSQDINRALGLMDSAILPTSGALGQATSKIGGTAAGDISSLLDTVKANTAFDKLAEMRKASPTGAALGSVTERELNLLASVRGSLEQSQSPEQLRRNLTRLNNTMLDIVHGPGQGPARIEEKAAGKQTGPRGAKAPAVPQAGAIQDGYRFKGGNPADPNSWEQVR